MDKKKVLVTGATGYFGGLIIEHLLKHSPETIIFATSRNEALAKTKTWYPRVTYVAYDIENAEPDSFLALGSPDILIHTAWQDLDNYRTPRHVTQHLPLHYRFIESLVNAGLKDATVLGTCFEYGIQNGSLREDMPVQPILPYAVAKFALERMLNTLKNTAFSFNYKWLRQFYIKGNGQPRKTLFSELNKAILRGDASFPMSGGEQLRDYLEVDEVVKQIVCSALQTEISGVINCCSGIPVSVRSLVENYIKEIGSNIKLELGVFPYPTYESMEFWGDPAKIRAIMAKAK